MAVCTGNGDRGGGHCCWIAGETCGFLTFNSGDIARCGIWDEMGGPEWQNAPVGQWFADAYPGFTCHDWPQNIPEVMAGGIGLCCWQGVDA